MSSSSVAFSTLENSTSWILAFDGIELSFESTGELPATSDTSGTANCRHCSEVSILFALTLKNEVEEPLGNSTVARVTPPGCTKLLGTPSTKVEVSSSCPGVVRLYSPG